MSFIRDGIVFPDWAADVFDELDERERVRLEFVRDGGDDREIFRAERAFLGGTLEELGFL